MSIFVRHDVENLIRILLYVENQSDFPYDWCQDFVVDLRMQRLDTWRSEEAAN